MFKPLQANQNVATFEQLGLELIVWTHPDLGTAVCFEKRVPEPFTVIELMYKTCLLAICLSLIPNSAVQVVIHTVFTVRRKNL